MSKNARCSPRIGLTILPIYTINFWNESFNVGSVQKIVDQELWIDAKSKFQEIAQNRVGITPSYKTLNEAGPDHDKIFTVGVFLGATLVSEGRGDSKQEAEQAAAHEALREKNW